MGVINFSEANCKNCYSCVRACQVHAVRIKNEQAEIIEERCIACGNCLKACPKNAKEIKSELASVKEFIRDKHRVAVSIAPSFIAAYGSLSGRVCSALKMLGINFVEETVNGADLVTQEYEKYAGKLDDICYITSCCPGVNLLIKIYHPDIINRLIPVISPMECHGRKLKQKYGHETKVVFIGPCLTKKIEAKEENTIDAVLTFEELNKWLNEEGIKLSQIDESSFDCAAGSLHEYPVVGGITNAFKQSKRDIIHVDGMEECMEVIDAIRRGSFQNALVEMSLCRHGCINGPAMPDNSSNPYERRQWIKKYALSCKRDESFSCVDTEFNKMDIYKEFKSLYRPLKEPDEEKIKEILMSIGKNSRSDELNCGTCGYKTCREKAIAVYNKIAEPTMCLPYMRQKAETLSSTIFDLTPNVIVIINKYFKIVDFNPSAEKFFNIRKLRVLGLDLSMLIDTSNMEALIKKHENIYGRKTYMPYQDATVLQSIIWIESQEATLLIMQDISESVRQEEKLQKMKMNSIEMAQKVIDKQMRVAQEIASLLGETTAETKVSLTKLKRLVQGEEVDLR